MNRALTPGVMWRLLILALAAAVSGFPNDQSKDLNVNSRYTIEKAELTGRGSQGVSKGLRLELEKMVGTKLDSGMLDSIRERIKKEIRNASVNVRVVRGTKPEHVAVSFEISRGENTDFDLNVPKALYHAKQGWSGGFDASYKFHDNRVMFGAISDGDALAERFAGIHAGYERLSLGTDALGLRFRVESYRSIWNDSTLNEFLLPAGFAPGYPGVAGIYRSRETFTPELVVRPTHFLELSGGVRMANFETQYPVTRDESANAVIGGIRFRDSWQGDRKQEFDAGYTFRAATRELGADYVYRRHAVDARYKIDLEKGLPTQLILAFLAGRVDGTAPMFDRFVLGNFQTLRGWNKFDLSPLGGSRVVHGTAELRVDHFEIFYDTGTVWDQFRNPGQKHSVGGGLHFRGFHIAVAFPLRSGGVDPVFMIGTAF